MKITKLIISLLLFTSLQGKKMEQLSDYTILTQEHQIDKEIMELWSQSKIQLTDSLPTLKKSPIELYFIASNSYNILLYAFKKKNHQLTDELLKIYMRSTYALKKTDHYSIFHQNEKNEISNVKLKEPVYIWTNQENQEEVISSSQFLFVVSFAFYQISEISPNQQTETMKTFIQTFSPILSSHYRRWILGVQEHNNASHHKPLGSFDRRGWGCKDDKENYIYARTLHQEIEELMKKPYRGASYCNVVADPILLIVSGLGYYMGAEMNQPKLYTIKEKKRLRSSLQKGITLISQRFQVKKGKDFNKKPIKRLSFQEGEWYGHPDYDYSGYMQKKFPQKKDKYPLKEIGLDVAHGDRVLYFLEMLNATKQHFSFSFPTKKEMKMFSDGFLYNVFSGDDKHPIFKNYMDGSNGWFRVNYDSREGYGYAPFSIGSIGAVQGGYPRLAKYNKRISTIFIALYHALHSEKKEDRHFIHTFYEKTVWSQGVQQQEYDFKAKHLDGKSALFLMNFYCSLVE